MSGTPEVSPLLLAVAGAIAAGASGLGGFIRFVAWWKDRKLTNRIESAAALAEKGAADWQKVLGQRMLTRAHFARLTGIDVPDGHASLLALHERLGGTDIQLRYMRHAIDLLNRRDDCAHPRDMTRRDWFAAVGLAFSCLVFVGISLGMLGLLAVAVDRVDWNQPVPMSKFLALGTGGFYSGVSAWFSWSLFRGVNAYIAASQLRQAIRQQRSKE